MSNPIWILRHLSMVNKAIDLMCFIYDIVQMFSKTKPKIEVIVKSSFCSGLLFKTHTYITTDPLHVTIDTKNHIKS